MSPVEDLDEDILSDLFKAGGWSEAADDNAGGERLPQVFVAKLVSAHAARPSEPSQAALAGLGVLILALSVAEWGVLWDGTAPADPARLDWRGPPDIRQGKHLMSYALGGIGLPHLDVAGAARFYRALAERVPAARQDLQHIGALSEAFRYDPMRARGGTCAAVPSQVVVMRDLGGQSFHHGFPVFGGGRYCSRFNPDSRLNARAWQVLRHWSRVGLRRRDMQDWIVKGWLNEVWVPAYNEVFRRPHGTLKEALVIARMWNSSKGDALAAIQAAGSESDPTRRIQAALTRYGEGSSTKRGRIGVMQRPGAVYDALRTS